MKDPDEKGPRAVWIAENRLRLYGTNMQAFIDALAGVGYVVADSTVRGWEAGANAKPAAWKALAKLFGGPPPEPTRPASLEDLIRSVNDLVAEMRLARADQTVLVRSFERVLDEVAKGRTPSSSGSSSGPRARAGARR